MTEGVGLTSLRSVVSLGFASLGSNESHYVGLIFDNGGSGIRTHAVQAPTP